METRPFPIMLPRVIPMLEERKVAAQRIVWMRGLIPNPDLPMHVRCYKEAFAPLHENDQTAG